MLRAILLTESLEGGGIGHLSRCLAISHALERIGFECRIVAKIDKCIQLSSDFDCIENQNWISKFRSLSDLIYSYDVIIVDSYHAELDIYNELSLHHKLPVYIDDYQRFRYPRCVVINGSIGARKEWYSKFVGLPRLVGVDYTPLRKEFLNFPVFKVATSDKVLISLGGHDVKGLTFRILEILYDEFPALHFCVIVNAEKNKVSLQSTQYERVRFYGKQDAAGMVALLASATMCITTGGQTTYEVNRCGVHLIAIGVADNQRGNLLGWRNVGVIGDIIWFDDPDWDLKVIREVRHHTVNIEPPTIYVDGCGGDRIAKTLKKLIEGTKCN